MKEEKQEEEKDEEKRIKHKTEVERGKKELQSVADVTLGGIEVWYLWQRLW